VDKFSFGRGYLSDSAIVLFALEYENCGNVATALEIRDVLSFWMLLDFWLSCVETTHRSSWSLTPLLYMTPFSLGTDSMDYHTDSCIFWAIGIADLGFCFFLWPPYVIGGIIFLSCGFFLLSSFFFPSPNFSGCRLDVYHTSTHGVALVRI